MGKLTDGCIDNAGNSVTHLLFINDYFIVIRVTLPEAKTLWRVIEQYYAKSGHSLY